MDTRHRYRVLIGVAALLAGSIAAQPAPDSLPQGVSPAMLATGKKLFGGQGLCLACHGGDGKGTVGPNLTDQVWLHGTGSFREIVARVLKGVDPTESKSGQIMPPKGGSDLTEAQVQAVAAYVWSLSRQIAKRPAS